jgi:hypothetical protein
VNWAIDNGCPEPMYNDEDEIIRRKNEDNGLGEDEDGEPNYNDPDNEGRRGRVTPWTDEDLSLQTFDESDYKVDTYYEMKKWIMKESNC